jgi:hypothetical protein
MASSKSPEPIPEKPELAALWGTAGELTLANAFAKAILRKLASTFVFVATNFNKSQGAPT